jgi:hypothetical protein
MPPEAALASLDAGDERGVGAEQRAELSLRQSSSSAKRSESATEHKLILFGRRWVDGSFWPNLCYPPTVLETLCRGTWWYRPPAWHRELRPPGTPAKLPAVRRRGFLARAVLPGPPTTRRNRR